MTATQAIEGRVLGRVDERGGELAATRFVRLGPLPLVPRGSYWVRREPYGLRGLAIRRHGRSIAMAYLRAWCPLLVAVLVWQDSVPAFCAAALALALWAISWAWRMVPGEAARRRSDLYLLALGTRCDPRWMTEATRARVRAEVSEAWRRRGSARSPEDVARFGSASFDELVAAYGVLAMHGLDERSAGHAASELARGAFQPQGHGGVFRTARDDRPVLGRDELARLIHARAEAADHTRVRMLARVPLRGLQAVLWGRLRARLRGHGALAGMFAIGVALVMDVRDPDELDFASRGHLAATMGTHHRQVRVACDRLERFAPAAERVELCHVGKRILPVLGLTDEPGLVLHGALLPRYPAAVRTAPSPRAWEVALADQQRLDLRTYEVYLDVRIRSKLGQIVLGVTVLVVPLGLLLLWERERRRRNRVLAAADAAQQRGGRTGARRS